ncbi:hypothetical protein [Lentzea flaviverrucosa]|uniref:Excreted virulence factor EspC, type VII ESX diderm n=1 Tax=Lentzea flaviverrucosa TaxID=200379 RepID=A0A1H9PPE7_9PSEU|nr:hypothetical protein [Lentzea flaviverrucosa]RDI29775.1 hypothetical protein DFR72_105194 [Lentzea flaviverrucosa]SER50141.1 hypothetical protein SAMN05216195_105378 [Lentzea flaviverrucosa]
MAATKFNTEAMEQCRTTVSSQAGQFGAIGDGFSGQYGNPDIFGKLGSSGAISAAVSAMDQAGTQEFEAAEKVLRKAEGALDTIQTSVADVEDANRNSLRAV